MSFAEAFTKGFVTSYQQSSSNAAQGIRVRAKEDADRIRRKQEELDKATKADQATLSSAKTLAENFGQTSPEAVQVIANQLKAGVTPAALMSGFATGRLSFRGQPGGASTQNAVFNPGDEDQQTMDAFDEAPEDADVIPFKGTSQTVSQASGGTGAAPAVPFSPSGSTGASTGSGGTGAGEFRLQVNQKPSTERKPDFVSTIAELEAARASGDPTRIQQAENNVRRLDTAKRIEGNAAIGGRFDKFVRIREDGTAEYVDGTVQQTVDGTVIMGLDNQPLTGVRPLGENEIADRRTVLTVLNPQIQRYTTSIQDIGNALPLADDIKAIVEADPTVLTRVSGAISSIASIGREFSATSQVLRKLIEGNSGEGVTLNEVEAGLARSGALPDGMSLDDLAGLNLSSISNLSQRKALFDAKIFLLAFRTGALEGQSGQAMSDNDYVRLMRIISSSSNAEAFNQQLNDYLRQSIRTIERTGTSLNSDADGLIGSFKEIYGYSPVSQVVPTVKDFLSSDPDVLAAYERVMETRGVRQQQEQATPSDTQAAPPAAATPTAPQTPVDIPGYTFVRIEGGRAVYVPVGGGDELVDTRYTY